MNSFQIKTLNKYENIKDILSVTKFSKYEDQTCFQRIAATLNKYGKLDKYVVNLLHTHYEIFENEQIFEYQYNNARLVEKTPINIECLPTNAIPVSWRLFDFDLTAGSNVLTNTIPLEYSTSAITGYNLQINDVDTLCFKEIGKILAETNNLNRFGLGLFYESLYLNDGEISLESTEIENRINVIEPKKKSDVNTATAIQTSWKLNKWSMSPVTSCNSDYETWCDRYCETTSWCEGNYYHNREEKHRGAIHRERKSYYHRSK